MWPFRDLKSGHINPPARCSVSRKLYWFFWSHQPTVGLVLELYQISVHKPYNLFLLKVKLIQNGKKKNIIYHTSVDAKKNFGIILWSSQIVWAKKWFTGHINLHSWAGFAGKFFLKNWSHKPSIGAFWSHKPRSHKPSGSVYKKKISV